MMNDPRVRVDLPPILLKKIKQLKKKYPHIEADIKPVIAQLENGGTPGEQVQGIGRPVYKVRVRNTDARRGKSGGYRVLYYLRTRSHIFLFAVYSKSEQQDMGTEEIRRMLADLPDDDTLP